MAFDATSLYSTAVVDGVYLKMETGYAFAKDMDDSIVEHFNSGATAILKIKYYKPNNIVLQHIAVEEEVKKIEVERLKNW